MDVAAPVDSSSALPPGEPLHLASVDPKMEVEPSAVDTPATSAQPKETTPVGLQDGVANGVAHLNQALHAPDEAPMKAPSTLPPALTARANGTDEQVTTISPALEPMETIQESAPDGTASQKQEGPETSEHALAQALETATEVSEEPPSSPEPPRPRVTWEPCAVTASGELPAVECMLPSSVALLGDLSQILNTTTWNELLTEDERDQLRALLPGENKEEKESTVERLFSGENFAFGNPVKRFFTDLQHGFYHKDVVNYKEKVEALQRRKYELDLMSYRARQLQFVLSWKSAAGLIKPDSAEARVMQKPPRRIYAPTRVNGNVSESSPASKKRKRAERERELREAEAAIRKQLMALSARKEKNRSKDKTELEDDARESKPKSKKRKLDSDIDDTEEDAVGSKKKKKKLKDDNEVSPKKVTGDKSQPAGQDVIPIVFVFFGKLREAFRKLNDLGTLDAIVEKLKECGAVEEDRLPQYPLNQFVKLALDFMASPPPPTAPFSLGNPTSSSTSAAASSSPSKESMPIVKYESHSKAWRWVAKEHRSSAIRLQSVEQLFYFAAARNMIDPKTGKLTLANVKQHKSAITIETSSPEATAAHRLQETERYGNPEKPYTYVTNGMKAVVGPVKHSGSATRGPSNKPREHFLLKTKRPAHVNLLGLVRDATARLPGGVGTRPDVSLLLKDSQWVVETIPNSKLNAVVSGALDRLHSQNDPCVRFDPDQKLWIYLHRLRKENDFEVQPFPKSKRTKKPNSAASASVTPAPSTPSTPSSQHAKSPQERSPSPRANAAAASSMPTPTTTTTTSAVTETKKVADTGAKSGPVLLAEEDESSLLSLDQHIPLTPPSSSSSGPSSPAASPHSPTTIYAPQKRSPSPISHPSYSSPTMSSSSLSTSTQLPPLTSQHHHLPSPYSPSFPSLTLPPLHSPASASHLLPSHSSPYSAPPMSSYRHGTSPPHHVSSAHASPLSSPSLGMPTHLSHGGSMPFAHYSSVPPPSPLPPLHPYSATSVPLHSPFSPSGSSGQPPLPYPSYSPAPTPSPLPRLQLPPVQPTSQNWPPY